MVNIAPNILVPLQGFQFATIVDFAKIFGAVLQAGFLASTIGGYPDPNTPSNIIYRMTVDRGDGTAEPQQVYLATPGHDPAMQTWLIYDGVHVTTLTDAAFTAKYHVI